MDPVARYDVALEDSEVHYACAADENALNALARTGRRGIPLGCRGGGCGVCKVEVTGGDYGKRAMSRSHVSAEDEAAHRVLACCIYPRSDLRLKVIGQLRKAVTLPERRSWAPPAETGPADLPAPAPRPGQGAQPLRGSGQGGR